MDVDCSRCRPVSEWSTSVGRAGRKARSTSAPAFFSFRASKKLRIKSLEVPSIHHHLQHPHHSHTTTHPTFSASFADSLINTIASLRIYNRFVGSFTLLHCLAAVIEHSHALCCAALVGIVFASQDLAASPRRAPVGCRTLHPTIAAYRGSLWEHTASALRPVGKNDEISHFRPFVGFCKSHTEGSSRHHTSRVAVPWAYYLRACCCCCYCCH